MKSYLSLGLAAVLLASGSLVRAAAPAVTEKAEWQLSGTLKGRAHLTCLDPSPSPARAVEQAIPAPVGIPAWVAKAQFSPAGSFKWWETDAKLQQQPLAKWTAYTGTWTQTGARLALTLDGKSAKALIASLDGASKCAGSSATTPCFDARHYKFTGRTAQGASGPRLILKQAVRLGVRSLRAAGQFHCGGQWRYTKAYRGQ